MQPKIVGARARGGERGARLSERVCVGGGGGVEGLTTTPKAKEMNKQRHRG
jgi:hypothetical protein